MKNRIRPRARMFAAQADGGEPTNTGNGSAPSQPAPQESTDATEKEAGIETPKESAPDDDEEDNPDGRGSKRAVLKDLAEERDKRQAAEAARDEYKERLEAIDREKMTELERAHSDLDNKERS